MAAVFAAVFLTVDVAGKLARRTINAAHPHTVRET
ncbi:hypothetical protein NK6_1744 [Bradyrhizobium diazoefficiens]|jgi:hypothetical protein|uniref:Uncharacterized protein n=1 Tax=Bradyrhizobium diazoefficiens TaxID=1355477 RepID=A0A0E4FTA3_9BRAD|nr:hypothetical protein NK6_1744 [Bradyrhizobium diazoefficiens]